MGLKPQRPAPAVREKQLVSQEALNALLDFIRRKFYQGEPGQFAKDRKPLLKWVVFFPASWLNARQVAVPADRYRQLVESVLMDALRYGNTGAINYRPAWLGKVIQSHFDHHGDEIYERAKQTRAVAEHALLMLGKLPIREQDQVVAEFAAAGRLLEVRKSGKKPTAKPVLNDQLSLL